MSKTNLLDLRNDYTFKRTFGYSGDEEITKVFLHDILQAEISEITLDSNPITEKELLDDKMGIPDIKAVLNKHIQCDIEMQVVQQSDIEKRIMFYWSKLYSNQIKAGKNYETLDKTIAILIADFELDNLKTIKKYITKWNLREEEYQSVILTDVIEIYIIELPKFVKYVNNNKLKNLNLWVEFIKNPEVISMSEDNKKVDSKNNKIVQEYIEDINDDSLKETKQAIQKAKEKLEQLSQDEHERYLAHLREKYIRDQYSLEKHGYIRGKAEIAKIMKQKGMSYEEISEITGLSLEEIKNL